MENKIQATNLEDIDVTFVKLNSGKYLIDGEVISVGDHYSNNKVKVKNVDNIRRITEAKVFSHYEDSENNKLTKTEYENKIKELTINAVKDGRSFLFSSEFEDDKLEYKDFLKNWNEIEVYKQNLSDPFLVEIVKMNLISENPFIKSLFLNGTEKDISDLFIYNREGAYHHILREYMDELGFKFAGDKNGYDIHKEWSNSTHSCIRYARAFGCYLFNKRFDSVYSSKGTYKDLVSQYETDKKLIREIVYKKYIEKFGDIKKDFDIGFILEKLENCREKVKNIDSKVKTVREKTIALNSLHQVIKFIVENSEVK